MIQNVPPCLFEDEKHQPLMYPVRYYVLKAFDSYRGFDPFPGASVGNKAGKP